MLTENNKSKGISLIRTISTIVTTALVCAFITTIVYYIISDSAGDEKVDPPFVIKKWVYIYIITVLPALVGTCRAIYKHNLNTR
jgi:hypothetical protein